MSAPLDPRIAMRDALRALVRESPGRWDKPSLFVLRNRLLDRTGSDARPLAEFLIEALRRGWQDRLPGGAMETGRFDATVAPFVLQWSRERFVQPEMARWATESWAYALDVIDESQLRVAPPPKRESVAAMAARLNAGARAAGAQAAQAAASVVAQATTFAAGGAGARPVPGAAARPVTGKPAAAAQRPAAARSRMGAPVSPPPRFTASSGRLGRSAGRSVPQWIPRALFGTICVMLLTVVGRVALANVRGERSPVVDASAEPARGVRPGGSLPDRGAIAGGGGAPGASPASGIAQAISQTTAAMASASVPANVGVTGPGAGSGAGSRSEPPVPGAPTLPAPALPSNAVPTSGRLVAPTLTGGVPIVATEKPGVPSITRGLLAAGADSARMVFVQPARRAAGDGRRMPGTPTAPPPTTFDELHFANGSVMQGRVEVVRAGTVIFRDMRTGLRHEYRKDDIDEVITEFGNVVRFRAADEPRAVSVARPAAGGKRAAAARGPRLRDQGVGGRYRIRYAKASAVGSPECTQVWTRPPNAEDVAFVSHTPGADTLSVAFEGGDQFPSNVDPDGYFASTFRIVPDQARTMTALTTRLNGRFLASGALELTVNIVFYRRLRGGELTCNVTVNAEGRREK